MITLGVIPARGGSKEVPMKNIRSLCGKPLIVYTIASAKCSQLLSRLVLSTDNEEIAKVSEKYSCEVILRPAELATDNAPTEWALIHAIDTLREKEGFLPDIVLTLEPTAPFRTATLIDKCIKILEDTNIDSVIGVAESRSSYGTIKNGIFEFLFPRESYRRQEREPLYKESGTIYATRTDVLIQKKSVIGNKLHAVIVDEIEGIDINSEFDFSIAEALMKARQGVIL